MREHTEAPPEDLASEAREDAETATVDPSQIRRYVERAVEKQQAIEEHEAEVKRLKKEQAELLTRDIPTMLDVLGTGAMSFTVGNHEVSITLEHKVRGTLNSAPDTEAAIAYLAQHGFEGAMQTKVSLDFKEGELDEEAVATLQDLAEREFGKDVHLDRKINPQTLMAFVREQIKVDPNFNPKIVGATVMREAKLSIK